MSQANKSVLLIVPEFPPNDSIGGRRWAKFAKYLAKQDVAVKVIAFEPKSEKKSQNWMSDISDDRIEVFYVPSGYPRLLQSNSSNLFLRICKKIVSVLVSAYDGGIIQDKALFFQKTLLTKASELINKHTIKNVICSGPYHRASYFTVLLKKSFSDLNVIIDFRDRWTDGQVYGLERVSQRAFEKEESLQKYTCEHADHILSTYQEIINELKQNYPNLPAEKFNYFSHNYDLDDYKKVVVETKSRDKIKFIYGGTVNTVAFYDGFKPFFLALKSLKEKDKTLYSTMEINIYGENYLLNGLVKDLDISDVVHVFPKMNEEHFYKEVSQSDFLMSFLGTEWKDLLTTKNITYLPFKKPIIVVSKQGLVSNMVMENGIGYHFDPDNCYENLVNLLHNYKQGTLTFNTKFDYAEYSYERATERLIKLLK